MNTAELRLLWQDETALRRLTQSAPPTTHNLIEQRKRDGSTWWEDRLEEEPADRIGQSLSGELIGLIGGIRADFQSYGPRHPIRRALAEFDRRCRRSHHASRWFDHYQGPLCSMMLRDVIEGGASVRWCAERYAISWPRAERLILAGMNFVGDRYARWEENLREGV